MYLAILRYVSAGLLVVSGVVLIALQIYPLGWLLLSACGLCTFFCDQKFLRNMGLLVLALAILAFTAINTDIGLRHMLTMATTLSLAVFTPYIISRYIYKDHAVQFRFHHGRYWYKSEVAYVVLAGVVAYFLLPFYLQNSGAYLNWPSTTDASSVLRLFIGTNALGIWDELFFVSTVLGILRQFFSFAIANLFQATLFTSFLYELGFTGWGFVMIFLFALLQGYIFKQTESLFYVISIHLTVDLVLFLALVNAHHPEIFNLFVT